jgi:hypothetical protein
MYVRVVRFTGVTSDRIESLKTRIEESGGPPPGVNGVGVTVAFDEGQGTAVVTQAFEDEASMLEAAKIFEAMDPGETPGTRASVDTCEVVLEFKD